MIAIYVIEILNSNQMDSLAITSCLSVVQKKTMSSVASKDAIGGHDNKTVSNFSHCNIMA